MNNVNIKCNVFHSPVLVSLVDFGYPASILSAFCSEHKALIQVPLVMDCNPRKKNKTYPNSILPGTKGINVTWNRQN